MKLKGDNRRYGNSVLKAETLSGLLASGYREMGQLRYFRSITYIAKQSDAWINKFFQKIWRLTKTSRLDELTLACRSTVCLEWSGKGEGDGREEKERERERGYIIPILGCRGVPIKFGFICHSRHRRDSTPRRASSLSI